MFSFNTDDTVTGAVRAAAISAALALRVLRMVLETAARKQTTERLSELIGAAGRESERLAQLAEEDGAAYTAYLQARKDRSTQVQASLRRAIETPLAAARVAAAGIDLCVEAGGFTRGAIAADVGGAAALLAGAVRAILGSVDANLRVVDDEAFAREVRAERRRLEERATARAEEVLRIVSALLTERV